MFYFLEEQKSGEMLLLKAKKANFKIPCKLQHSQKIK
jgi:hypothetical protein